MRLLGRFLCWIGFHDWEIGSRGYLTAEEARIFVYAKRCMRADCGVWGAHLSGQWIFVRPNNGLSVAQPVSEPVSPAVDRVQAYLDALAKIKAAPSDQHDRLRDEIDSTRFAMTREEYAAAMGKLAEADPPIPASILFFPGGVTSVRDQRGQTMANLSSLSHEWSIEALKQIGIDYHSLSVLGTPSVKPPE